MDGMRGFHQDEPYALMSMTSTRRLPSGQKKGKPEEAMIPSLMYVAATMKGPGRPDAHSPCETIRARAQRPEATGSARGG